jgi:DNA-binding response OmpR family regulator
MKILIVEDDEEAAAFVAAGLNARGHQAAIVTNGRDGFDRAIAGHFDAIILDRMLPELRTWDCRVDAGGKGIDAGALSHQSLGH